MRRRWTWTCCSGAGTTGCSPARARSTCPPSSATCCAAGYTGPLSLEVFNDVFRQSDPARAAVDAHRSLLALHEATVGRLPDGRARCRPMRPPHRPPSWAGSPSPNSRSTSDSGPAVADTLTALGFAHTGQHRTKPVQLWSQGGARVLLNASSGLDEHPTGAAVAAIGLETRRPDRRPPRRAQALLAPVLPRRRGPAEADLSAVAAPTGQRCSSAAPAPATTAAGSSDFAADRRRRRRRRSARRDHRTSTTSR